MSLPSITKARLFLFAAALLSASPAAAQFESVEYLCVKTKTANVREAPSSDAKVVWKMWKYFPVEVDSYRGDWLKIKDFEGDKAWMERSALDDTKCAQAARRNVQLRKSPGGAVLWILDKGYPFRVFGVKGDWVEVSDLGTASGWVRRSDLWGAFGNTKTADE